MNRFYQQLPYEAQGRSIPAGNQARAAEYFEHFLNATTIKNIMGYHRTMCELLHLKPTFFPVFYPKLKSCLNTWKAKALWKKLDARASHKCYGKGKAGEKTRVLIIGGGPCGLRTAIEAQLLGCKVVVVEKRDRLSRNNVLHLWPFVIEDLRMLGAKKFFGKFCAGAIDHISIRQLQCILFKVALLLGVEIHTEVSFENLIEPSGAQKTGWKAQLKPSDHPVSQYEFDVVVGADGKRNTLQGFKRKEFRGKLAIAITANFINKRTEAEARVEEISGVAFIFNQKFFKDLYQETGIDLENIVYYKDDTHYFVMTAKKASLLEKGVIIQDMSDTERLLSTENVNREALLNYAKEAAEFSTNYQMLNLEFAVNHYGQPDVAMFDFTSMFAADNASKVIEREGYRLLMVLVGDSLLEPFWPTGSGCARGFLSSLDAAWAIRSWSSGKTSPLDVLAERESIYRLLAQTTPDNLNKDYKSYTLEPSTRYPNYNRNIVMPHHLVGIYDTDDVKSIERIRRNSEELLQNAPKKRRRDVVDSEILINWIKDQIKNHQELEISDLASIFRNGKVLGAVLNHYRPDLFDYDSLEEGNPVDNNQTVMDILERDLGISPVMSGEDITITEDYLTLAAYLTQIYDSFRTEIPHVKHPKLELPETKTASVASFRTAREISSQELIIPKVTSYQLNSQPRPSSRHKRQQVEMYPYKTADKQPHIERRTRKRRSVEKLGASIDYGNRLPNQRRDSNLDEDFAARIKNIEEGWQDRQPLEKKPKDLMRAIGKIQTSDWNIKEIEKKIKENKMAKPPTNKDKEKVPKWSKEQFLARQTKMEKQHLDRQDSAEAKYADIDKNIKHLELKLKEGTTRDLGQNKVATLTEKLTSKTPEEPKSVQKSQSKTATTLPTQGGSEFCHFCNKKVYLMERLSAEGRFFHHGCFKCQYCHTQLRLGSYAFDKDGQYGYKFFCLHHFGMQGEAPTTKLIRKPSRTPQSPEKRLLTGVDLLDRVQTPERIEFSNLSTSRGSSDPEESLSQMDEDEWTDRNFGASTAEFCSSDDESSSYSDADSDDEEGFKEALEEPVTKEGTIKWAKRLDKRYSSKTNDSDSDRYIGSSDSSSYYENTSDDDDSDTATEGEDEIRARELRKQEVRVDPPVVQPDTGTDTEVVSDESSSNSSNEIRNSATEISTDSEFAQDEPTPTREVPSILLNDFFVTKTRGSGNREPKKFQVTSAFLQKPSIKQSSIQKKNEIELKLTPLVPYVAPLVPSSKINSPNQNYALNRTQSTGGIATKVSLELKKRYLLGESANPGTIQKSGSASTLDTKFKSFHSNISDCQKLLKSSSKNNVSGSRQVTVGDKLKESDVKSANPVQKVENLVVEETENKLLELNQEEAKEDKDNVFENVNEGRPRSPVHETSIIVPEIDWKKAKNHENLSSSSESSSSSTDDDNDEVVKSPNFPYKNIPTVEIHEVDENLGKDRVSSDDDVQPDSLFVEDIKKPLISCTSDSLKSIGAGKKTLNQPKSLPELKKDVQILSDIHVTHTAKDSEISLPDEDKSGRSTPEQLTAALTETELSDWAKEGTVSDSDLEDANFDFNLETNDDSNDKRCVRIADMSEFDDFGHVCGTKLDDDSNIGKVNLDSIEFMDTGTETSSDGDKNDVLVNTGYVLFSNDEEMTADSLNPMVNDVFEAKNVYLNETESRKSFEAVNDFGGKVTELKACDLEKLKRDNIISMHEQDSLLVVETETTTEENTCSDSTVKNVTEIFQDQTKQKVESNNSQRQRLEEKLAQLKKETQSVEKVSVNYEVNLSRLKSHLEFDNAKDSMDERKLRRKSQESVSEKPDLILEENGLTHKDENLTPCTQIQQTENILNIEPNMVKSPDIIYRKDIIQKERDVNQRLIQEMVLGKMRAENKHLERKKRNRGISGSRPFEVTKSITSTDVLNRYNSSNLDRKDNIKSTPPDVVPLFDKSEKNFRTPLSDNKLTRPLSVFSTFFLSAELTKTKLNTSLSDLNRREEFCTPVAPPRTKNDQLKRNAEKLKSEARARARLLSNEELGLSPEDKIAKLRERNTRRDKENDHILEGDFGLTEGKKRDEKKKSGGENSRSSNDNLMKGWNEFDENQRSYVSSCRSHPNLVENNSDFHKQMKGDIDKEKHRKSIKFTKIMDLFSKKSPKGLFSKISSKSKSSSKVETGSVRRNSMSEMWTVKGGRIDNDQPSPPPVPPLPLDYTGKSIKGTDDSSETDLEWTGGDTLNRTFDVLHNSLSGVESCRPKPSRVVKKCTRQTQSKRHRMAQEIQRKLEETEVKTRELEERGVFVEKALRGEIVPDSTMKDEPDLLQEWFDLMRDRTELRRYEKGLIIRAQEMELEDRHSRLQQQLRQRLDCDYERTSADKNIDCKIVKEMMDIVSKRDALITVLEEDRQRYSNEDKDFEEQILAKNLHLIPLRKNDK